MSVIENYLFRHQFFRFRYTELNEIFAFMSLRSFAVSMIAIFIPIYFYKLGYSLSAIFIYFSFMYLFELLSQYPVAKAIKRYGPKHLIILSVPLLILHFSQMLSLSLISWPLWSIALSGGLTLSTFWQSYHYDFSRAKHRRKASREVGKIYIIIAIIGAMSPFLGGLISEKFGVWLVFLIVITLMVAGVFILLKTKDDNFRRGNLEIRSIDIKNIKMDLLAYMGGMLEATASLQIWPMFLFFIIGGYLKIGFITSLALMISILATIWVSKKSDSGGRIKMLKIGGFSSGIINLLRISTTNIFEAMGFNVASSLANSIQTTPLVSEYYLHADETKRSEYIFLMESSIDVARITYYIILAFIYSLYPSALFVLGIGIIIGGIGAFLTPLMSPAKCEICGPIQNKNIKLSPRPSGE